MTPLNSASSARVPATRMRQCAPAGVTCVTLAVTSIPGSGTIGCDARATTDKTGRAAWPPLPPAAGGSSWRRPTTEAWMNLLRLNVPGPGACSA
jgi:hypothetical protein